MTRRRLRYQGSKHARDTPRAGRRAGIVLSSLLLAVALVAGAAVFGFGLDARDIAPADQPRDGVSEGSEEQAATEAVTGPPAPETPSRTTEMTDRDRVLGDITPKSVEANGHGLVIANNMMYRHTVTVYDAEDRGHVASVSDEVELADFGIEGHPGLTEGAPVEAAWTSDGRYAYVSQYRLQGQGHGATADDQCTNGDAIENSALFRLDAESMDWDQVIEVGRVPKFVALSPDESLALVSNWCDETVSVVDLASGEETAQIPVDAAPRGIVVLPDNRTAYVTAMFADELYRLDLAERTSELVRETGDRPRHLVLSPDGERMYLTEAGEDRLVMMDGSAGILASVDTGREPRTMDISSDGTALYAVNYYENTVSKFDAETLEELQREEVGERPVGVTYEPTTESVWVANYAGSIDVFDDSHPVSVEVEDDEREDEGPDEPGGED